MMAAQDVAAIRAKAEAAGQGHVFRFWDELSPAEQTELLNTTSNLNFENINKYYTRVMDKENSPEQAQFDDHLAPLNRLMTSRSFTNLTQALKEREDWYNAGLDAIAEGQVAVILLAGGQGTRLGSSDPKGMYDVHLPSGKSLFQLQAERIRKVEQLAEAKAGTPGRIAYYIMTSQPTHEKTVGFFEAHDFFGLDRANVRFFKQNTLPCLSMDGKILLETKSKVAVAPDGNGGIYRALVTEGILADMEKRGIQHIHAYSVDNVLVKVADPYFIGFSILRETETSLKVVPKVDSDEKVGVLCKYDGKYMIVEYSEVTDNVRTMQEIDEVEGVPRLLYDAGNICNHYFHMDFLHRVCQQYAETLTHHIAKKQIPAVDEHGNVTKVAGMKLELFIFDILKFAHEVQTYYANRDEEFSPLKNAPGASDGTPQHCFNDLLDLHKRFIIIAGGEFADEDSLVEISPLVSYDGEGLEELVEGKTFAGITQLC